MELNNYSGQYDRITETNAFHKTTHIIFLLLNIAIMYTCKTSTTLLFASHLVWDLLVKLYTLLLLSSVGPGYVAPSWSPHTQEGLDNPVLQYAVPLWCRHLGWCNTNQEVSLPPSCEPVVNIFKQASHSAAFIKQIPSSNRYWWLHWWLHSIYYKSTLTSVLMHSKSEWLSIISLVAFCQDHLYINYIKLNIKQYLTDDFSSKNSLEEWSSWLR